MRISPNFSRVTRALASNGQPVTRPGWKLAGIRRLMLAASITPQTRGLSGSDGNVTNGQPG